MSRTLSKILIICAMVVIIPLMIVGTAFATYYSIDATVGVAVYTGQTEDPNGAFAVVQYKDETGTELEITEGHLNEITLRTVSNGYKFVGWFEGTAADYSSSAEPKFTENEITIKMTDYANLLAVFEIKEFDVSYDYLAQGDDEETTQEVPADGKTHYAFGEALPVLTYENYNFLGWKIQGDETNTVYTTASFETTENIVLEAVWQEQAKVTIQYRLNADTIISTEEVYKDRTVVLSSVETLAAEYMEDGYTYSWADADNATITQINIPSSYEGTTYDVYLKATAISYTAQLQTSADATYNGSTEITFTVENYAALAEMLDASNWETTYSFYSFDGLTYNSTTYTDAQTLVDAVVAANPESTTAITLQAVINKNFTTFTVSNGINCYVEGNENVYVLNEIDSGIPYSSRLSGRQEKSSDSTIYQLLDMYIEQTGEIRQLYTEDRTQVQFSGIRFYIQTLDGGNHYEEINTVNGQPISGETTLLEVIEEILSRGYEVAEGETFTLTAMTAWFE